MRPRDLRREPLRAAIDAVAQQDPDRIALTGRGDSRTYGELARLLDAAPARGPRRAARPASSAPARR